jgi:hypothetical protein
MDWLFEADRDAERRFPWISIPGVGPVFYDPTTEGSGKIRGSGGHSD